MNIIDLRIGTVLYYHSPDGEIFPCRLDWQDIKWFCENPSEFNQCHTSIPLNEVVLMKIGFSDKDYKKGYIGIDVNNTDFVLDKPNEDCQYFNWKFEYGGWPRIMVFKFLHELQNFFVVHYGKELEFNHQIL